MLASGTTARSCSSTPRLMAAAQRLEIDLLMAMPPHEREARFRSARVESLLELVDRPYGRSRRYWGLPRSRGGSRSCPPVPVSPPGRARHDLRKSEFVWSFLPEADLPELQDLIGRHSSRAAIRSSEEACSLRQFVGVAARSSAMTLTVTILKVDRGRQLLAVEAGPHC